LIEILSVSKRYGGVQSLDDLSLTVRPGEIFGYVGPNGAGKTTTAKILTGLVAPSSGDAKICGHSVVTEVLAARTKLGFVPESGALFERLTPREHLSAMGALYRLGPPKIAQRIDELLTGFGLQARIDERMETFSKGMKQKICWCAALIHEPEVLLLDEPLNGLDADAVRFVKDLLEGYAAQGRTIFYTSHLLDIVERVCTRIGVLKSGRLIAVGTAEELCIQAGASGLEAALMTLWRPDPT
jgi:ABC-2 type transport system ATP-binding protein